MDWMKQQFVPAAEAMPEDKFFWAPTSGEFRGVRNFRGTTHPRGKSQFCAFCGNPW